MVKTAAYVFVSMLLGLTVFQLALIFGAPLGHFAWGGAHEVLPLEFRVGSCFSLLIYAAFAAIVLTRSGVKQFIKSQKLVNIGIWTIVVYSFLGVVMNSATRSTSERAVMAPLTVVLSGLSLYIALATRRRQK